MLLFLFRFLLLGGVVSLGVFWGGVVVDKGVFGCCSGCGLVTKSFLLTEGLCVDCFVASNKGAILKDYFCNNNG